MVSKKVLLLVGYLKASTGFYRDLCSKIRNSVTKTGIERKHNKNKLQFYLFCAVLALSTHTSVFLEISCKIIQEGKTPIKHQPKKNIDPQGASFQQLKHLQKIKCSIMQLT